MFPFLKNGYALFFSSKSFIVDIIIQKLITINYNLNQNKVKRMKSLILNLKELK